MCGFFSIVFKFLLSETYDERSRLINSMNFNFFSRLGNHSTNHLSNLILSSPVRRWIAWFGSRFTLTARLLSLTSTVRVLEIKKKIIKINFDIILMKNCNKLNFYWSNVITESPRRNMLRHLFILIHTTASEFSS